LRTGGLRRIFGLKRDEVTGDWRDYRVRNFMLFMPQQIVFG
jgi:hypothetical protein